MSALDDLLGVPATSAASTAGGTYRWATVTGTGPLRVRLDGDVDPVGSTPAALCPVSVDDRVWVQIYGRQLVVIGVSQPA